MHTTVTEFRSLPCTRCGGARFIAAFQHRNGGECFRCGATGVDPQMKAVTRDMTDAEVLAAMCDAGFPVMFTERPVTNDFLADLFLSPKEVSAQTATIAAARTFLAALPA